jgi:predicted Fe-Mo cluster-binding NifX family protein
MKVAVSAQGGELSSLVDARFGRAPWFIIADTESEDFLAVENTQNLNAPQGAGIQAAQTVANQDVKAVLTGHCGPKAFRVLTQAGIKLYVGVEGKVSDALEQLKAGTLQESVGADVEGHW